MADPFFRALAEKMVDKNPPSADDFEEASGSGVAPGPGAATKDKRGLNPLLVLAPAAAEAFDAYSTRRAMAGGGHEANSAMEPFAGNPAALYGTKIGTGLLAGLLADRLARSGHRTAAKIVAGLEVSIPLGAGIHNMTLPAGGR